MVSQRRLMYRHSSTTVSILVKVKHFYAHAQRLASLYQQLHKIGTIAKFQQMKYLEESTKHLDAVDEARINYLIRNPLYADQNYDDMVLSLFASSYKTKFQQSDL